MKQKISKIILLFIVLCFYTSLISQSISKTSNKKSPTKLIENPEGRLPNDDEVILRKVGIIISLKAAIYSQPDINSPIIDYASLGDIFFVQDIVQTLVRRNQYYRDEWFQIVFPDYTLGWVNAKNFKLSEIKGIAPNNPFKYSYIPDKKQKLVSVMAKKIFNRDDETKSSYHVGRYMPEGWDEVYVDEKAWVDLVDIKSLVDINIFHTENEVCLNFLWEKAKQNENFDEEHSYSIFNITKKDILYRLTDKHRMKKNYDKAIECQEICMQLYPESASPYLVIGNIHWYSLNNIHDALDFIFQIFHNIPERILSYDEHNTTVHYQAFDKINRIIADSYLDQESSLYYYQKVIEITDSPLAYVQAVLKRVKILRQQQKFELALVELNSCLEKYPSVYHSFHKDGINYSYFVSNAIFNIKFYDLHDPNETLQFCRKAKQFYNDSDLSAKQKKLFEVGISFYIAKISDETNGDRNYVINLYERLLSHRHQCCSLHYPDNIGFGKTLFEIITKRIKKIKSFNIREGILKSENALLCESPNSISKIISILTIDDKFSVLYPLEMKNQTWYKIKTSEDIIGWIQANNIQLGKEIIIEKEVEEIKKNIVESHTSHENAQTKVVENNPVKHVSKTNLSLIYAIVSISIVILFAIILIVVSKRKK